jgi:hypothetical protein
MTTFTIDSENNLIAHAGTPANADHAQTFSTEKEFARLTADWPGSRLVEVWNRLAGAMPFELKAGEKVYEPAHRRAAPLGGSGATACHRRVRAWCCETTPVKAQVSRHRAERRQQQESPSDRHDAAAQGSYARRDHGGDRLPEAYGARLRQPAEQPQRHEGRVLPELCRGT